MKITKELSQKIIVLIMAIMSIVMFTITLSGNSYYSENGFTMIEFSSEMISSYFLWAKILMGIISCVLLIMCLICCAISLLNILSEKYSKASNTVVIILTLLASFLYFVMGLVFSIVNMCEYGEYFYTTSYIPLIYQGTLAVCYLIVTKKSDKKATEQISTIMKNEPISEPLENIEGNLTEAQVNQLMLIFSKYIPADKTLFLRERLLHADKKVFSAFTAGFQYKDPTTTLLLSIFLGGFGVDRFYIGDTGLGVAKLLLGGFTFGIWAIVDIFLCYKKAKEVNLNNILAVLN